MLGSEAHPEDLTLDLGQDWAISSGYHKMNACCQYAHSAIEAIQETLQNNPQLLGGDEIVKIEIETHPLGMTLNNFKPVTTLGAKFSLPHALAAAVVFGDGNAQSFGTDSLLDERVTRLRERVDMRLVSEQLPWPQDRPAFVTLVDTKGHRYQAHCMSARGGSDRPFTDEQLWSKIDSLSSASAPSLMQVMQSLHAQCDIQPASKEWSQPWRNLVDQFFKPVPNPSTFHLNDA
jgi:2-methylcitrate dehydratase PrpD